MSNVVFELFAKLGLDSSEYEKGLNQSKSLAGSVGGAIGNGLKTMAKVGVAAIGTATAAVGAFATSSVKTGAEFDKSMSQVAATMGKTMDEMQNEVGSVDLAWGTFSGNLREYAQEMGKNTAFSATQAADALNYMALAGYDTQTSMEMLPNVLNLAAAGNMDLARASDMVTDTQTAFGISLDRTSQMVDEMAKAASTGNTSVEQLGDAFLVVGGLAQEMNGGMVELSDGTTATYDNIQELEIALTAMANAGIKGSEAGTHMRNMLLKLSSPTKEGVVAFENLGVSVFDSEGKMRSLSDIMGDLNNSMSNLTQEEKLQAISDIFNTRDVAAAEALMSAVGEDWDKIGESILSAQYNVTEVTSAIQNASVDWTKYLEEPWIKSSATMGDAWKSLGEQIAYNLQTQKMSVEDTTDFIASEYGLSLEDAQKAVESVSDALGDMKGAAQKMADTQLDNLAGDVTLFQSALEGAKIAVSDGLTPTLRQFVQFGTSGLSRLTDAFQKNGISGAMEEFGNILAEGIGMVTEMLPDAIDAGMKLLGAVGQGILDNLPVILDAATQILSKLGEGIMMAIPSLLTGAMQIIMALGQYLVENAPTIISSITDVIRQIVVMLTENAPQLVEGAIALLTGLATSLIENAATLIPAIIQLVLAVAVALIEQLPTLVQAIIDINIALVQAIIENAPLFLQACLQIVVAIVNLIVQYGGEFLKSVNDALKNIWNRAVAFAKETLDFIVKSFKDFVTNVGNGMRDMFNTVVNWLAQLPGKMAYYAGYAIGSFIKIVLELPGKVSEILNNVINKVVAFGTNFMNKAKQAAKDFLDSIVNGIKNLPSNVESTLNDVMTKASTFATNFMNKAKDAARDFLNGVKDGIANLPSNVESTLNDVINKAASFVTNLANKASEAASGFVTNLKNGVASLPEEFATIGSNIVSGIWNGISGGWDWLKEQVSNLAKSLLDGAKDALGIESPSKEFAYVGRMVDEGFAKGLKDYSGLIDGALDDIISLSSIDNMVGDLSSNVANTTGNNGYTQILNITSPVALTPSEVARQARNATRDMVLAMSM